MSCGWEVTHTKKSEDRKVLVSEQSDGRRGGGRGDGATKMMRGCALVAVFRKAGDSIFLLSIG